MRLPSDSRRPLSLRRGRRALPPAGESHRRQTATQLQPPATTTMTTTLAAVCSADTEHSGAPIRCPSALDDTPCCAQPPSHVVPVACRCAAVSPPPLPPLLRAVSDASELRPGAQSPAAALRLSVTPGGQRSTNSSSGDTASPKYSFRDARAQRRARPPPPTQWPRRTPGAPPTPVDRSIARRLRREPLFDKKPLVWWGPPCVRVPCASVTPNPVVPPVREFGQTEKTQKTKTTTTVLYSCAPRCSVRGATQRAKPQNGAFEDVSRSSSGGGVFP